MVESVADTLQTQNTFQRNAQNMLLGKKTNVLLVRDEVGKAKPATRTIPKGDFSFGKANVAGESAGASK